MQPCCFCVFGHDTNTFNGDRQISNVKGNYISILFSLADREDERFFLIILCNVQSVTNNNKDTIVCLCSTITIIRVKSSAPNWWSFAIYVKKQQFCVFP